MKNLYLLTFSLSLTIFHYNIQGMHKNGLGRGNFPTPAAPHPDEVPMSGSKSIHLSPENPAIQRLYTRGLTGCTALLNFVRCKNGTGHAHLSHHLPVDELRQKQHLLEANQEFISLCGGDSEIQSQQLLVMTPGEHINNNGRWELQESPSIPYFSERPPYLYSRDLSDLIKVSPKVIPYDDDIDGMAYSLPDFSATFDPVKGNFYKSKADRWIQHPIEEPSQK